MMKKHLDYWKQLKDKNRGIYSKGGRKMNRKVYQELARLVLARQNCIKSNNHEWKDKHETRINFIVKNFLPSGSGIDSGNTIDLEKSNDEKLIIYSSFHAMNEDGYCDRWIDFTLIVKPSLSFGILLDIKGKFGNRQDIKEYLYDIYRESLEQVIEE